MIRLQPTTASQTFSIIPSSFSLGGVTLSLTENGTNIVQSDISYSWEESNNGNFIEITLTEPPVAVECNFANLTNLSGEVVQVPYIDCINNEQYLSILQPYQTIQNQVIKELGDISGLPITVEWVVGGPVNSDLKAAELKEGSIYTIKLHTSTDILYKDLVYVTSQTDKKKVHSINSNYKEVARPDDEYIIL